MRLATVFFIFASCFNSIAQDLELYQSEMSIQFALEEHDKRLFDYPDRQMLLDKHPGFLGSYQLGIKLQKRLHPIGSLNLLVGAGLTSHLSTFTRPYDHAFREQGPTTFDLRSTDFYLKNFVDLSVSQEFDVSRQFGIQVEARPEFAFLTVAAKRGSKQSDSWWGFNFHSTEFNLGLILRSKSKLNYRIKYRVFNVQRIDKILFNDIIKDPRVNTDFETVNPFKIWFNLDFKFTRLNDSELTIIN